MRYLDWSIWETEQNCENVIAEFEKRNYIFRLIEMASKDALNAAYEDVRSDSSDTVWYVFIRIFEIGAKPDRFRSKFEFEISWKWIFRSKNQIWFVKIELNFLGQHLAAVKRASNQIITEPTYKNFCNNLQVTSLKLWSNVHPLYYLSRPKYVATVLWQAKDSKYPVISPKL